MKMPNYSIDKIKQKFKKYAIDQLAHKNMDLRAT